MYTQPRSPRLNFTLGVNCGIVELWNYLLHCPWPHPPPRPSQENNVEVGKLWEFRGGRCNKYFHNSTVYTGGKRHTNVTLQGSGRRREMQHGSVGFRPPCGQKCNVPRCNCSVGFLPHCHAAFLGAGPRDEKCSMAVWGLGHPAGINAVCHAAIAVWGFCHTAMLHFWGGVGGTSLDFRFHISRILTSFWDLGPLGW